MKKTKIITLLVISLLFVNCITNNEKEEDLTIVNDEPEITFNVDAVIALAADSDITELVTFNGEPAGTYTSELQLEETLTVGKPTFGNPNDQLKYVDVTLFKNGEEVELNFETQTSEDGNLKLVIPDGKPFNYYLNPDNVDIIAFQAVNAEEDADIDYKYDLEVMIIRDNVEYGPYIIDPKIKIRALSFSEVR